MSYIHPAALAARRKYWTRPDAYRFAPPGTPEAKMPGWLDPSATRVRLKEAQEEEARRQAEAAQEEFERGLLELRWLVKSLRTDLLLRELRQKYSPDQPRDELGRWTSGANSVGDAAAGNSNVDAGEVLSDASPDPLRPGAQYAQNEPRGVPIDLLEEQRLGGHAIEGHVGKSHEFLLARARREALSADEKGDSFRGVRISSFSSLDAANKLVNATIAQNSIKVERVASGLSGNERLDAEFDSVTGYEAYARTERSQPYIRDTNGVRVVIVRDRSVAKGYRVDTAFPINFGR